MSMASKSHGIVINESTLPERKHSTHIGSVFGVLAIATPEASESAMRAISSRAKNVPIAYCKTAAPELASIENGPSSFVKWYLVFQSELVGKSQQSRDVSLASARAKSAMSST